MIEKMKFVSISGPWDDLDRMVNEILSRYEIQFENAMTELKSVSNLAPCPGDNPYRDIWAKVQKLVSGYEDSSVPPGSMPDFPEAEAAVNAACRKTEELDGELEELRKKSGEIHSLLEQVRLFRELDFNIPVILNFRHICFRFGRVQKNLYPQLEAFAGRSEDTILCKCHETDQYVSLLYFVPAVISERIDAVFSSMQFEQIFLQDQYDGTPAEEIERLEKELTENQNAIRGVARKRSAYLEEKKELLLRSFQVIRSYYSNYDIRKYAARTQDKDHPFYILCGWIPEDASEKLRQELKQDRNTFYVMEDDKEHASGIPPTKLKNPALIRPFELFVRMYGLPAYGEFDPTLLIAVTYSIFFGFMFGDAGQGLLLFLGGFLLYRLKKMDLAAVVSCCGFFSAIFGFMFGSVFGFEDIIAPLWLRPSEAMTDLPFIGRLNTVFVVAIAIGMGIILLVMILNMAVSFRAHDPEKTWFDTNGLAGFLFYLNVAVTITLFMTGHRLPAAAVLTAAFIIPLLIIFFKEPLAALVEKKARGTSSFGGMFFVQGFFELFEVLLSYFSNTLSFVRVGAFAVSHAAMMEVVLMLAGAETGSLSIPVIVFGNLFVCAMEGLIVGIQVLRLEYYELFSRFYRGNGREFRPFRDNIH